MLCDLGLLLFWIDLIVVILIYVSVFFVNWLWCGGGELVGICDCMVFV